MGHSYVCRVKKSVLYPDQYVIVIVGTNGKLMFVSRGYSKGQANARARQFVELVDGRIALED